MNNLAKKFQSLEKGWDGYSAEAPNQLSFDLCMKVKEIIRLHPIYIQPSAEGGMALKYKTKSGRYLFIECYNDGEICYSSLDEHGGVIDTKLIDGSRILPISLTRGER